MFHRFKRHHAIQRQSRLTYVVYSAVALLLAAEWILWIAPLLTKMPDHFSYSANILSLDNFYDETTNKFEGEHISKTTFSFEVEAKKHSYLVIKNLFNVRKLSDKPIFSVARLYFINPVTGQHVVVAGEEERSGYLFAPHYASEKPFQYWHINYDAPALMKFVNKEEINGLTVYHYQAHYEADQTANLTNLPGVPDKRGIKTDVNLQLWIEPISGWLIKYQDNTLAYYYDKKTGARLEPWNSFSNRYTQNSVSEKVEQAEKLKWKFLIVDFGIPLIIVMIPFLMMLNSFFKKHYQVLLFPLTNIVTRHRGSILIGLAYSLFAVASIASAYYLFWYKKPPSLFKIGISQWNNNMELQSAVQGFKDGLASFGFKEGKNVQFIIENPNSSAENQIRIIQSFVRDQVDIIFTLTTPGTLVAKGVTDRIPIVFTDVSYPVESGIIHADSSYKTNVVGTLNYISPAEQFFRFDVVFPYTKTLGFVHHKGDPDSEIQYLEYKEMLSRRNIAVVDIPAIDINDINVQLTQQLQSHPFNALFVTCDTLMRDGGGKVAAEFSRTNKIPSFTCDKDSVLHGVMIGYFAELYSIGKLAGIKAALILHGAELDWLHSEAPKQGYLITNEATAKLLGITIPMNELQQANSNE